MTSDMLDRCSSKSGDSAFHIGRSATVNFIFSDLAGKRSVSPTLYIASWHHVSMASKNKMRIAIADFCKEILNIRRIGLTKSQAMDFKTNRR